MINYLVWLPAPNEAVKSGPRIEVRPSPAGVDARWKGPDRARWVEAGDGAAAIANKAMIIVIAEQKVSLTQTHRVCSLRRF